jgi:acyl-CoA thioesterase-1
MTALRALLVLFLLLAGTELQAADPPVVLALGDSITRGARAGVKAEETFAALLAAEAKKADVALKMLNAGVGGERTDGALARLDKLLGAHVPKVVLIMYGTNDSFVERGEKEPALSAERYRENLVKLIETVRKAGGEPVLMTPPRWAPGEKNALGEDPNERLEKYVEVCRAVAKDRKVKLVDHYAHWTKAGADGTKVRDWTTDGCHPNPRGHREMADLIRPVLLEALGAKRPNK